MKISVVIPAHNRPDFLKEAIQSIAEQTYTNWEAVIVDDGSNPPLPVDQMKNLLGDKARYLRHERPLGVARAKNAGIAAATGEIIALLDDDDLLEPTALEKIHDAFSNLPELDCVFLGVEAFGPFAANPRANRKKAIDSIIVKARPTDFRGLYVFDRNLFHFLVHSVPIDFQRPAARRGAWNVVGGFDEAGFFSESSWAIKASTICKIALTRDPLTYWRIHGDNFGWPSDIDKDQAALRQVENTLATAKALEAYFVDRKESARSQLRHVKSHLAEAYFSKACFLRAGNRRIGLRALLRSLFLAPRLVAVQPPCQRTVGITET